MSDAGIVDLAKRRAARGNDPESIVRSAADYIADNPTDVAAVIVVDKAGTTLRWLSEGWDDRGLLAGATLLSSEIAAAILRNEADEGGE